ncbi:hypothetical protein COBT_001035, partial [Conglomerata obtusa]
MQVCATKPTESSSSDDMDGMIDMNGMKSMKSMKSGMSMFDSDYMNSSNDSMDSDQMNSNMMSSQNQSFGKQTKPVNTGSAKCSSALSNANAQNQQLLSILKQISKNKTSAKSIFKQLWCEKEMLQKEIQDKLNRINDLKTKIGKGNKILKKEIATYNSLQAELQAKMTLLKQIFGTTSGKFSWNSVNQIANLPNEDDEDDSAINTLPTKGKKPVTCEEMKSSSEEEPSMSERDWFVGQIKSFVSKTYGVQVDKKITKVIGLVFDEFKTNKDELILFLANVIYNTNGFSKFTPSCSDADDKYGKYLKYGFGFVKGRAAYKYLAQLTCNKNYAKHPELLGEFTLAAINASIAFWKDLLADKKLTFCNVLKTFYPDDYALRRQDDRLASILVKRKAVY